MLRSILLVLAVSHGLCGEIRVLSVVSSPDFKPGLPGVGSLGTIICTGLTGIDGTITGSGTPLPTSLAGVRLVFGAREAPLLSVTGAGANQQINFQVPLGATGPPVLTQGTDSAAVPADPAPWGQFFRNNGLLYARHASDYRLVTQDDPPRAGEWILAFGSNFGNVVEPPQSGFPASLDKLSPLDPEQPIPWKFRVRLDSVTSEIPLESNFIGLAPGSVGVV